MERRTGTPIATANKALLVLVGTTSGVIASMLGRVLDSKGGREGVQVVHFDSAPADTMRDDGDSASDCIALAGAGERSGDWGMNRFVHIAAPGEELMESVDAGEREGYDTLPPQAAQTVASATKEGVGGLRSVGPSAARANAKQIRGTLDQKVKALIDDKQELYSEQGTGLRVFEFTTSLGGTQGALSSIHRTLQDIARKARIALSTQRVIGVPGMERSEDMESAYSNTAAYFREAQAAASGVCMDLEFDAVGCEPQVVAEPSECDFLVSDVNDPPGMPRRIKLPALNALIANWFYLLIRTPLGARLSQVLMDFMDDADVENDRGERRKARSFGLSFITLGRHRLIRNGGVTLTGKAISALLAGSDEDVVQTDVKQFVRVHRLHEGAGYTEISSALCSGEERGEDLLERLRHVVGRTLSGLDPETFLNRGAEICQTAVEQSGDFKGTIDQNAGRLIDDVRAAMDDQVSRACWDHDRGITAAKAWVERARLVFENMKELAGEDQQESRAEVEELTDVVNAITNNAVPGFLKMGPLERYFAKAQVAELSKRYAIESARLAAMKVEDEARSGAIRVLSRIGELLHTHEAILTDLERSLADEAKSLAAEKERILHEDGTLMNPNGFRLDDDLDYYYSQTLRRPGDGDADVAMLEEREVKNLISQLGADGRAVPGTVDAESITKRLRTSAEERVRPYVMSLTAASEFFRRYADKPAELMRFLRERDAEAYERIRLRDTATEDNPCHIMRFVLAGRDRGAEIAAKLNRAASPRSATNGNAEYELLELDDDERIVLVQVMLTFPFSEVDVYRTSLGYYRQEAQALSYEKRHRTPMGRALPDIGVFASDRDAEVAMLRAYAIGALQTEGGNGSLRLVLHRHRVERVAIGTDIHDPACPFKDYATRVELASRFGCHWRLVGSEPIRRDLSLLSGGDSDATQSDGMGRLLIQLVSPEAVAILMEEMDFYERSTNPAACIWSK